MVDCLLQAVYRLQPRRAAELAEYSVGYEDFAMTAVLVQLQGSPRPVIDTSLSYTSYKGHTKFSDNCP